MAVDYDRLAHQFDERYRHQPLSGVEARLRALAGQPGIGRALEIGCGTGHWLAALGDLPLELTGLDPSFAMLRRAAAHSSHASLVCATAEALPFHSGRFDFAFCVNALHHFTDAARFLRENRLLLRSGGMFATFGLDPHSAGTHWYLYDYFPGVREADLARYLPVEQIQRLLREAGFTAVTTEPVERIVRTFTDSQVFDDPFLVRESTSQLLIISENAYREGRRAIQAAVETARREGRRAHFDVSLILFATTARSPEA
jgi:SAM-dependent methyltransferase